MKIIIENSGYELKNIGDIAMLVSTVKYIHDIYPSAEIYIPTSKPDRLKRFIPIAIPIEQEGRNLWGQRWNLLGGLHKIFPTFLIDRLITLELFLKNKFPKISCSIIAFRMRQRGKNPEPMLRYLDLLFHSDHVIASGGGYITDEFYLHARGVLSTLELAQNIGKNTAMFGQGLGPITDKVTLSLARRVFPKLAVIGLREGLYSIKVALNSGANTDLIKVTGDDAIPLAIEFNANKHSTIIGVNLRISGYSGVGKEVQQEVKKQLNNFASKHLATFNPIPISFHSEDSDVNSIAALLGETPRFSDSNDVNDIIHAISECKIIITGSYHAGVFALSMGIPVVAIVGNDYYKQKFDGLKNQFDACIYLINANDEESLSGLDTMLEIAWSIDNTESGSLKEKAMLQANMSKSVYRDFLLIQ